VAKAEQPCWNRPGDEGLDTVIAWDHVIRDRYDKVTDSTLNVLGKDP